MDLARMESDLGVNTTRVQHVVHFKDPLWFGHQTSSKKATRRSTSSGLCCLQRGVLADKKQDWHERTTLFTAFALMDCVDLTVSVFPDLRRGFYM